jgi:formylglycine-generating enzyme required for sulfatase activity
MLAAVALLLGDLGALVRLDHNLTDRRMDATVASWRERLRLSRPREAREYDALCRELASGLGPFGYQWLCACAVYPGLRLPITSYLGAELAGAVGRKVPDEAEHMVLARLPWFRTGWMPDELRLRLLRDLEPPFRNLVREAIERLIFQAAERGDRPQPAEPEEIARPSAGWSKGFRAWLKTPTGTAARQDRIFVRYMLGGVPRAADLELSRRLTRLFRARLAGWFDRWTLLGAGTGILVLLAVALYGGGLLAPFFAGIRTHLDEARAFRECPRCPRMLVIPPGNFAMGATAAEMITQAQPQHEVTVPGFALGETVVTFDKWEACVADGGCNKYQPNDVGTQTATAEAVPVGDNEVGEPCRYRPASAGQFGVGSRRAFAISCGGWDQPSGRIFELNGAADIATLRQLATTGPWWAYIDQRFSCGTPVETSISGGAPALLMQCTRRTGGWPHVAMVAAVGGSVFLADGIRPVLPAIEVALASIAGQFARPVRPVINSSWDDAQAYVSWLTRKSGHPYRLPSEAEWEYAARGGTRTAYPWGDYWDRRLANGADSVGRTTEVATYAANPLGFYDVIGNVWEWVEDCWHDSYQGAPKDGSAWVDAGGCNERVARGGSWSSAPGNLRVAIRNRLVPGYRAVNLGFRVSRTLTPGGFTPLPPGGSGGAAPGREILPPLQQQAVPQQTGKATKGR